MRDAPPGPDRRIWLALLLGLAAGCATLPGPSPALVPTRHQRQVGPFVVFANAPIAAEDPAIGHLRTLDRQLGSALGTRMAVGSRPVEVYILDDQAAFAHFLRIYYPELPQRRAFFLAQGEHRVVYAYRGERLEEDLRHEATHALLNASFAELPLWLDEGLAEYFEGPEERAGLNPEHLARLPRDRAEGWAPDLHHLEALSDVRQMTPRDYREAWAWAHYLLNGSAAGRAALLGYLADLRTRPDAAPLSLRLEALGRPDERLVAHLEHVRPRPVAARPTETATVRPAETATVRLQDPPAEPRRGLGERLREFFRRLRGRDRSAAGRATDPLTGTS